MGMPDQNKLSSKYDYIKVTSTLFNLRKNNPFSYPRKYSRKSGTVFSCLVNKENLSFVNDTTLSLHDRALQIQSLSSLQNTEIQIYRDNLKSEQYYYEELIDFYIYGLLIREKMFELAGKINNSKSESDISMQSGQKVVINGYVTMIIAILREQVKSGVYSNKDLDRLNLEASRSLIENIHWFGPDDRQKISTEMQKTIEKSHSDNIKKNYSKALKVLYDTNWH